MHLRSSLGARATRRSCRGRRHGLRPADERRRRPEAARQLRGDIGRAGRRRDGARRELRARGNGICGDVRCAPRACRAGGQVARDALIAEGVAAARGERARGRHEAYWADVVVRQRRRRRSGRRHGVGRGGVVSFAYFDVRCQAMCPVKWLFAQCRTIRAAVERRSRSDLVDSREAVSEKHRCIQKSGRCDMLQTPSQVAASGPLPTQLAGLVALKPFFREIFCKTFSDRIINWRSRIIIL